jgi:Toprim domain/CHC2 zinc finger
MRAADIAHVLGGRRSGKGYVARCPIHHDRNPSLSVCDGARGLLVHCFSGCDSCEILAELRRRLPLDAMGSENQDHREFPNNSQSCPRNSINKVESAARAAKQHQDHERRQREKAIWLWSQHVPIIGTPGERYLRARGYPGEIPPTLGFVRARDSYPPAIIAAFGMTEEREPGILAAPRWVNAVHLTRLRPDGSDRERSPEAKIMIGRSVGSPIVLAPVNDLLGLAITEGIEDALSVHLATGLGAWAAASAGRMPALADILPSYIETVTIFAHPEKVGQDKARELANKLHGRGVEVFIEGVAR